MDEKYEIPGPLVFLPTIALIPFLGFIPVTGLWLVVYAFLDLVKMATSVPFSLFFTIWRFSYFFLHGAVLLSIGLACISEGLANYQFCDDGLRVKYPLSKWELTPWEEFQQICICYTSYTTRGPSRAHTIVCFVKQGEKKNLYGRWKSDNPLHHRKVIDFDLEPDILLKLQLKCTAPIADLRGYGNYRHPENVRYDIKLKPPEELREIRESLKNDSA